MRIQPEIGMALLAVASLIGPTATAQTPAPAPKARPRVVATATGQSSYLGIGVQDVDGERAKALKLNQVRGAEITKVWEDSPAAKAGLKDGDVVLEYNGQPIEGQAQLSRMVRETPIGRQVRIGVWRNGGMQNLTATLEAAKGMVYTGDGWFNMPEIHPPEVNIPPMPPMEFPKFEYTYQNPMLGIIGESLSQEEQLADFFGVKEGVLVKKVNANSAAEKAGIKAGDIITKIDDTKVNSSREITSALRQATRSKKTVTVTVVRNRKEIPLSVTVETAGYPNTTTRAGVWVWPGNGKIVTVTMPHIDIQLPQITIPSIEIDGGVRVLKFPSKDRVI